MNCMLLTKLRGKKTREIAELKLKVAALEAELKAIKNSRPVRNKAGKKVVMQTKIK